MNSRHLQRMQPHWDWRAAGNFICGGAGAGLAFFAAVCATPAATPLLAAAGLALVGLGLFFVWLEIGRPLRAPNVMLHLRTSWMSREALAAGVLFALGACLVFGFRWAAWPTALAALAFLYCQTRLLGAARAIPTWRHPLTIAMLFVTGLTEGIGLFWLLGAWTQPPLELAVPLGLLVLGRWLLWREWRKRLHGQAARPALRAIGADAPNFELIGTLGPIGLVLIVPLAQPMPALAHAVLAVAGLLAAAGGMLFKFTLVTRTGYHHGFYLPRMPVRGVPRTAAH